MNPIAAFWLVLLGLLATRAAGQFTGGPCPETQRAKGDSCSGFDSGVPNKTCSCDGFGQTPVCSEESLSCPSARPEVLPKGKKGTQKREQKMKKDKKKDKWRLNLDGERRLRGE
jgi:hypothetical protein